MRLPGPGNWRLIRPETSALKPVALTLRASVACGAGWPGPPRSRCSASGSPATMPSASISAADRVRVTLSVAPVLSSSNVVLCRLSMV